MAKRTLKRSLKRTRVLVAASSSSDDAKATSREATLLSHFQREDAAALVAMSKCVRLVVDPPKAPAYAFQLPPTDAHAPVPNEVLVEYWLKLAHWGATAALVRHDGWWRSACLCAAAREHLGLAASLRALVEAAGDTVHSLCKVPRALAKYHGQMLSALSGNRTETYIRFPDLQAVLEHFHLARNLKGDAKSQNLEINRPETAKRYIDSMKVDGAYAFYGELCQYVHPAAQSLE